MPAPTARDAAVAAQLLQGPGAAGVELRLVGREPLLGGLHEAVEVVDQQQVDGGQTQALEAVLPRAHDAVVGVVVAELEGQSAGPDAAVEALQVAGGLEDAAHLGGQHVPRPLLPPQEVAHAVLGEAVPVVRGGVVEAHAALPGRGQRRLRLVVGDALEQLAEVGAAETDLGHGDAGLSDAALGQGLRHRILTGGVSSATCRYRARPPSRPRTHQSGRTGRALLSPSTHLARSFISLGVPDSPRRPRPPSDAAPRRPVA